VAKAFKMLGVIEDDDTSCTRFFPSNFSSRGDSFLKLTEGTSIEQEQHVIMDNYELLDMNETMESLPDD